MLKDALRKWLCPELTTQSRRTVILTAAGNPLVSLAAQNITDSSGAVTIDVDTLESPVTLNTLQLRDNSGVLEYSTDSGANWHAFVPKSLMTTKGDLIAASANETPARLGVGTNGYFLAADSAETLGVKWAAQSDDVAKSVFTGKGQLIGSSASATPAITAAGSHGTILWYDTTSENGNNLEWWQPPSRRNLLINAQFNVNQRAYASGTATSTGNQYTVDRWFVNTSGQNLSWTDSNGTRTVTAPAGGVSQIIEGTWLQGEGTYGSYDYVISWTGTATCTVDGTARTNGEAFTLTGGSNVTIKFSSGTVSNPQLEQGYIQTPFDWQRDSDEKIQCLPYYQKIIRAASNNLVVGFGGTYSTTNARCMCQYIPKRTTPTITITGGNAFKWAQYGSGGLTVLTTASVAADSTYIGTDRCLLTATFSSGATAGFPGLLYLASGSEYLEIDAEIYP